MFIAEFIQRFEVSPEASTETGRYNQFSCIAAPFYFFCIDKDPEKYRSGSDSTIF